MLSAIVQKVTGQPASGGLSASAVVRAAGHYQSRERLGAGYGYQFWHSRHGFYRGDGAHGQYWLILPQYDAVVAITAGMRDMASVMNLVWDRLVPALKAAPLTADASAHRKLTEKLAALALRTPSGNRHVSDGAVGIGKALRSTRTSSPSSRSR
jgi:CubicO group peptidase (beta-lactamase class C family)